MRVLLHLGLNKCGSTFVQSSLAEAREGLCLEGTWYPEQPGPPCQYGLSKAYGFGPTDTSIAEQSLVEILDQAAASNCEKLILSSEYLSLFNPKAVDRLLSDFSRHGVEPQALLFSRDIFAWIRSLYNQLIRMSDGQDAPSNIDNFIERVLANRAIDINRRYTQWSDRLAPGSLRHFRVPEITGDSNLLAPFEDFAGCAIPDAAADAANPSIGPEQLYRLYNQRRQGAETQSGAPGVATRADNRRADPMPADFLTINYDLRARVVSEITKQYYKLPTLVLPQRSSRCYATSSSESSEDRAAATSVRHRRSGLSSMSSGIR